MQPIPSDADILAATLKMDDLTAKFHVSHATIYRWIKECGFPKPVLINPRIARWKPEAVEVWRNVEYPALLSRGSKP